MSHVTSMTFLIISAVKKLYRIWFVRCREIKNQRDAQDFLWQVLGVRAREYLVERQKSVRSISIDNVWYITRALFRIHVVARCAHQSRNYGVHNIITTENCHFQKLHTELFFIIWELGIIRADFASRQHCTWQNTTCKIVFPSDSSYCKGAISLDSTRTLNRDLFWKGKDFGERYAQSDP